MTSTIVRREYQRRPLVRLDQLSVAWYWNYWFGVVCKNSWEIALFGPHKRYTAPRDCVGHMRGYSACFARGKRDYPCSSRPTIVGVSTRVYTGTFLNTTSFAGVHALNLSILISAGKEINGDSYGSCERPGISPRLNPPASVCPRV